MPKHLALIACYTRYSTPNCQAMKSHFKHLVQEYFNFSRKDRNALIVLSALIVLAAIANLIIDHIEKSLDYEFPAFESASEESNPESNLPEHRLSLFAFDPNTVSETQLDSLNLSDFIKSNILKYRSAGGKFTVAADIRRLYGMNDSIFSAIEPYLLLPEQHIQNENVTQSSAVQKTFLSDENKKNFTEKLAENHIHKGNFEIQPVELNSADSSQLVSLRGIGPVYAMRILKYRNLLGGFHSKEQLLEVYGISEETFHGISDFVRSDSLKVERLRLNFSDFNDFIRHPYFKREHVDAILNFRQKHGPFSSEKQLLTERLVDSVTFARLKPYITYR